MRIGFSNLISSSLSESQMKELLILSDCIDWAPTLTNPKWDLISENGKARVDTQIQVSAIQSLFFGIDGIHFMKTENEFQKMMNHLQYLLKVADVYNVPFILWGSPGTRNVDLSDISDVLIVERLHSIFGLFSNSNTSFLIEAVSPKFGCKFINSTKELVAFTEMYNLDLHLDTGQMIDEGLNVLNYIESNIAILKHVHISEPDFTYTGKYDELFLDVISLLKDKKYDGDVVLEVQRVDKNNVNDLTNFYHKLKLN